MAQYQGEADGHAVWTIEGETYTGSVSTVGGGTPQFGHSYPAWSNSVEARSQWVALVRAAGKVLPKEDTAPPTPTSNWSYAFADPLRTNSWTDESGFDWTAAEEEFDNASDSAIVRNERPPSEGYPFTFESGGVRYGYGHHTYARPTFNIIETDSLGDLDDDFESTTQADIEEILADASITYEFYGVPSLARVGGWAYMEIAVYNPDPESEGSYTEAIYVAKLNVARLDEDDPPAVLYIRKLYETTE